MEQYQDITLHLGDCLETLRSLPDKSFDLAIVDPPYCSGPERRRYYGREVSPIGVARHKYPVAEKWQVPGADYFDQLMRVARNYIVWGCNYYDRTFAHGRIVWDKCNASSTFSDCEIAATNLIESVRLFPFMWNGMCQGKSIAEGRVMQGNKALNEKRIHPTQKPVALYIWLLQTFARQGWAILDTHLGSGSSAIACHELGFQMLGIEIDLIYYQAAATRLAEYQRQQKLF